MNPPVLMSVVRRSPCCAWNIAPCIIRPQRNMVTMAAASSAPRPGRFKRKWPPPGASHANATAGAHADIGTPSGFACVSFAMNVRVYQLARFQNLAPRYFIDFVGAEKVTPGAHEDRSEERRVGKE